MFIEIIVAKEELEKLKKLEGFSKYNTLDTSYCDTIEFICQPERLSPEAAKADAIV